MRKSILVLLVLLVMSLILCFRFTTSLAQTAEQQAQRVIEENATRIYSSLSLYSKNDRRMFYKEFTPEVKSELWKIQLRLYLSKHSELSDKQRQVIEGGIAFITPEVYKIPQDSPEWEEKVDKPAQLLKEKMLEVFPREVAKELSTVLGGSVSPVSLNIRRINFIPGVSDAGCDDTGQATNLGLMRKSIKTQPQPFRIISASFDEPETCDCSTRSDWCPQGTQCTALSCQVANWCGTFGLYVCDGLCIYYPCTCSD